MADKEKKESGEDEIKSAITEIVERMRIVEERYSLLRKQFQLAENNQVGLEKELRKELMGLNEEISEIRKNVYDIEEKNEMLVQELAGCVKKKELAVLRKKLELFEPLEFCTVEDVKRIVDEIRRD